MLVLVLVLVLVLEEPEAHHLQGQGAVREKVSARRFMMPGRSANPALPSLSSPQPPDQL
ncbi:hypothetical protein [Pseudomonas aeruginosa]|uniref:hypothetical protein n=1 Tax=Pseudomonas aeruginosa TaxID=287 RepID=UPI0013CE0BF3|nr:hypothetical protein [Pseudomonas aeruginosa]